MDGVYTTVTTFNFDTEYLTWKLPSDIPVVLFWGEKDKLVPISNASKIQSVIPQVDIIPFFIRARVKQVRMTNEDSNSDDEGMGELQVEWRG